MRGVSAKLWFVSTRRCDVVCQHYKSVVFRLGFTNISMVQNVWEGHQKWIEKKEGKTQSSKAWEVPFLAI